ncbi:vesicle transport through interaction with t-SNAREs homolog 1A isoform X11 [Sagmatias obliquidens]|uniref:vesicle transport through interaction with t-SNAREs homolog 1A isoform X11 n=1 Tax=Sagmatias obliquidens TaxID=3371155 RepID=UPI000F44317F|nr:vesicle transport through interaction with t-SNAREs homolog 1A isoform X11 [Lagenorhynchus obliquidens]XP_030698314.1 vesicle transport through interaction with t-SNAREs homolog 1A isoform X10 [Globicephala melas]
MSSDFEGYEQDFAVLTAEITNKIARVPRLPPDEKKQVVANVEKQLEEAKELLEQMDLEVREIPPQSRGMYSNRMRSYKQEMGKLETDFKRSRIAYSDEVRNELLGDDGNSSENQLIKLREERAHLLDNTERLERSSRRLEAGYQIAVETEKRSIVIEICVKGIFKKCYFGECVTIPVEHQGTFFDKASHRISRGTASFKRKNF